MVNGAKVRSTPHGNLKVSLRQRTGLPLATMEHDLSCLYHAYAITTTRSVAAKAAAQPDSQPHSVGPELDSLFRCFAAMRRTRGITPT